MTYPATTLEEAVVLSTVASNQLHDVINGDENTQIQVEDGSYIPSVRKAMKDGFTSSGFGGQYRNLNIIVSGVGYQGTITVDRLIVEDSLDQTKLLKDISLSFNAANTGVNGLDTGTVAANNWYYIFVIYNSTTENIASLVSLSPTSPLLPSGYTYSMRVGAARVQATTTVFVAQEQKNNEVSFGIGEQGAITLVNGGTASTYTAVSTQTAAPPTALSILAIAAATAGLCAVYADTTSTNGYLMGGISIVTSGYIPFKVTGAIAYRMPSAGTGFVRAYGYKDNI